jgi:hypothetical protein
MGAWLLDPALAAIELFVALRVQVVQRLLLGVVAVLFVGAVLGLVHAPQPRIYAAPVRGEAQLVEALHATLLALAVEQRGGIAL